MEDNVSYVDSKKLIFSYNFFKDWRVWFSWNKYQFELFDWLDLGFRPLRLWTHSQNGSSIWTWDCLMNWWSYHALKAETNLHDDMASVWPCKSSIFVCLSRSLMAKWNSLECSTSLRHVVATNPKWPILKGKIKWALFRVSITWPISVIASYDVGTG